MTEVLSPHDDGRLYVAKVLHQYRDRQTGEWQVVGPYATSPPRGAGLWMTLRRAGRIRMRMGTLRRPGRSRRRRHLARAVGSLRAA